MYNHIFSQTNSALSNNGIMDNKKNKATPSQKNFDKAEELKDKFMSILAHDIQLPLRFTTMVSKAIITHKHELDKEQIIDAISDINNTSTKTLLLISNMLKRLEFQKDGFIPQLSSENLYQLVQDKVAFFALVATNKKLTIENTISTNLLINTDRALLGIVMQNLISNAIKFTPNGLIEIGANVSDGCNSIFIKDTGIGMDSEIVNAIVSRKSIVPQPDTDKSKGNGLGWELINDNSLQ